LQINGIIVIWDLKGCGYMYLYKLILQKEKTSEIIYLLNDQYITNDAFNKICDIVIKECKIGDEIEKDNFLEEIQWNYGFRVTKIECENTISL